MFKLIWLIRDRNFWKDRAESLEAKLESERTANRRYEREITSRILTLRGQVGISQPAAPEKKVEPPKAPPITEETVRNLTQQQQEDLTMYLDDADKAGIPHGQAWNDFFQSEFLSKMPEVLVDVEN
jgi:hypothetical protein